MQNDFIIALAWPEGMVASTDVWYDKFFAKKGKYRVGHSAVVLVERLTGELHYFDFGRYHTSKGFGRVRNKETDHDVCIQISAEIKSSKIVNIKDILVEIKNNTAFHGEGTLYASILNDVSFHKAYEYAKKIQNKGLVLYGPFVYSGTNCSRFVASVMRSSSPTFIKNARLKLPFCISPSPKRNVGIANANFYKVAGNLVKKVKRNIIESYFKSIERS
tara:strand:+ start:1497 stop:2150 length:654 start_codon:yes stop_codon:yes gene_type:complete